MVPVIDTHTHLDFPEFDPDRGDVLQRAVSAGVERMIVIGTRPKTLDRITTLCAASPALIPVLGYHPGNVDEISPADLPVLEKACRDHPVAALGECGLDYYRPPIPEPGESSAAHDARVQDWKQRQKKLFRSQLDLAVRLGLNVVVHQRESWDDCLEILRDYTGKLRAVFHCFGGTPDQAAQLHGLGHLVSFTGIVTFKNANQVQAAAKAVDDAGFMLETDCPYLAPVPHRGKRCEPAFTREITRHVAHLRGVSEDAIAELTNRTASAFFRLDGEPPTADCS